MPETVPLTAKAEELQILLNLLHEMSQDLVVQYPHYPVTLFTYSPSKGAITSGISDEQFDEARRQRLPTVKRLEDDLPAWSDIRDALITSGIITYRNEQAVREALAKEHERARDASNPNPAFLGFDTNALYNRVPSRALRRILPGGPSSFQFAVSTGVEDELGGALKWKYSDADLKVLRPKVHDSRRFQDFLNRPYKKARKARMARTDIRWIDKQQRGLRCQCDPMTPDKEENDRIIARSYGNLRQTARADVLVLTSDQLMQEHVMSAGVRPILLHAPEVPTIPVGPVDERALCRFLHDLSISFGVIRLVGLDTALWGDWSGKTPEHAHGEELLIEPSHATLMGSFERDLSTARRIEVAALGVR